MTIAMLLATGWLVATVWPELPIGRSLRRLLIDRPAAWAGQAGRGQVALAVLVGAGVIGAAWLGQDALNILAMGGPDMVVAFSAVDLASVLDVALTAVLAWTVARGPIPTRSPWRPGGRRSRRVRRPVVREAVNDDEDRPRLAA